MPIKLVKGRVETPLNMVISGVNGVGKSTFAAGMPKPLFIDLEKGTNHLEVDRVHAQTDIEVLDICHELIESKHPYKTLVLDSLDFYEAMVHKAVVGEFSRKKEGIEDISDIEYGRGYSHALKKIRHTLNVFDKVIDSGMNVCLIVHTHTITHQDPLLEPYSKLTLKLHAKAANLVKEWTSFLLFANYQVRTVSRGEGFNKRTVAVGDDSRVLFTRGSTGFDAKSRRPIVNDQGKHEIPLDFNAFKTSYNNAFKAEETKQ
tara:strand:- start:3404 stop:4183 length:780 start_codon:yes stop_codon:yes gene_type:complete